MSTFTDSEQQSTQRLTPIYQARRHLVQTTLYSMIKLVRARTLAFASWRKKAKSHYYQALNAGLDFYLEESLENTAEFYMTSQKLGVKKNDLIVVDDVACCTSYKILEISYYANAPDLWMARIAQV